MTTDQLRAAVRDVGRRLPRPVLARLRRAAGLVGRPGGRTARAHDRALRRFVARHRHDVRGRVLEVGRGAAGTARASASVEPVDLVEVDPCVPEATLVADVTEPGSLPASAYDCVVVRGSSVHDEPFGAALRNLHRSLAPGGVLLLAVPAQTRSRDGGADGGFAAFTRLLERSCTGSRIEAVSRRSRSRRAVDTWCARVAPTVSA